jgi:hypothetical protein
MTHFQLLPSKKYIPFNGEGPEYFLFPLLFWKHHQPGGRAIAIQIHNDGLFKKARH